MAKVTFTERPRDTKNPRAMHQWAVDVDGDPFGLIWTWKVEGEHHPYHSKPINGDRETHDNFADAKSRMLQEANGF